jgi:tetratricopeptide (TPR) repeat protein
MNRFAGFKIDDGLYILDQVTGEVTFIGEDNKPVLVRPGVADIPEGEPISDPVPEQVPTAVPVVVPEQEAQRDPFDDEVINEYPYPIARTYLDFISEKDSRQKCKLMVDTFTSVLKLWALQTASEYLQERDVKDPNVNQTLARDFARPLISAWNLMLFRALPVLEEAGIEPFAPELREAYKQLETKCQEKFILESEYEDAEGNIKKKKSKLAVIQALIKYRNSLAHGFNQSPAAAKKDLDTYVPLFTKVLKAGRFMKNYPLYYIDTDDDQDTVYRLMGTKPQKIKDTELDVKIDKNLSPLFMHSLKSDQSLPLFSFFDVGSSDDGQNIPGLGKDVLLFEGNTKSAVIYVSSTGGHFEKQSRMKYWKELLAEKAIEVKVLDPRKVNMETLKTAANRVTYESISKLISSGKYLREATVGRPDLEEHMANYEAGDYRGFILGGDTGIGKSTLFARYVEERQAKEDVVLFYRASALVSTDLSARILRDMGAKNMFLEDLLSFLDDLFKEQETCRFRVVIDAVNEHPKDVAEFVRTIDQIVVQAESYPWFRLVASVRNSAYERLPSDARFAASDGAKYYLIEEQRGTEIIETPVVSLTPIGKDLIPSMYEKYRDFQFKDPDDPEAPGVYRFRPKTQFNELNQDGSTAALMSHPMMMRIILSAYHRKPLPDQLHYDDVMKLYLEDVIEEKNSTSGSFPERKAFLKNLVKEMDKQESDSITRDDLYSVPALVPAMSNLQKDSPYVQLLDLGVILEEWDDDCYVRFCFDRLLEFMLAELHEKKIQSDDDIVQLAARANTFRNLQGALSILLLRSCHSGESDKVVGALDLCDPGKEGVMNPAQEVLISSVCDLFEHLALSKDPVLDKILEQLPSDPSVTDVQLLFKVFDRLFLIGEVDISEKVVDTAYAEAKVMTDDGLMSEALFRKAQYLVLKGERPEALAALNKAESLAGENYHIMSKLLFQNGWVLYLSNKYAESMEKTVTAEKLADKHDLLQDSAKALRLKGILLKQKGEIELAKESYEKSLNICEKNNFRRDLANVYNNLGTLELGRNNEKAKKYFRESITIKEDLGDRKGIQKSSYNLGILLKKQGDLLQAEKLYKKSLSIANELGDKAGISSSFNSLAILLLERGKIEEAEKLYRQSLAIKEELGDKKGISLIMGNIANLLKSRGEIDEAEKLYRQSLAIREELGNKAGISLTMVNIANLLKSRGEIDEAEKLYRQSLAIREELGEKAGIASSLGSVAGLINSRGEIKEAEKLYRQSLAIREELGDKSGIATNFNNLSKILMKLDEFKEAGELLDQSLSIREELGEKSNIASSLTSIGNLMQYQGDYKVAETHYNSSLNIRKELDAKPGISETLHDLGRLAMNRGELDQADVLVRDAFEMREKMGLTVAQASTMLCMGRLEVLKDNTTAAEQLFNQLLDLIEPNADIKVYAKTLLHLTSIYLDQDDIKKAEKTFDRSGVMKQKWQSPYLDAQVKALKLRIAIKKKRDKRAVSKAFNETVTAYDVLNAVPDIDESPVAALHAAALFYQEKGDEQKVKDIVARIKDNGHELPPVLAKEIKEFLNTFSGNGKKSTGKVKKKPVK